MLFFNTLSINDPHLNAVECFDNDVKVRDYCHITGKHKVSPRRGCNINFKLNKKLPIVFHNPKVYIL